MVIVGPTASGKTAVACEIAKYLPVEMISCDSMQVYRSMPILTQAPPKRHFVETQNFASLPLRTHLVSFLDPSEEYNAALFRKDALSAIEKIQKKGCLPMLVGGTGLYLRALMDGLFDMGDTILNSKKEFSIVSPEYRQKMVEEQGKYGGDYLHERLQKVDPVSASKIHPNDIRRIVRALEVHHVTGRPMSEQKSNRSGIRKSFHCRIFLLDRDRAELYGRIEKRVDQMLEKGLLGEVRRLSRLKPGRTASMALGYRQMKSVLEKKSLLVEAVELLKRDTRHYAKRQLSWFRHEKGAEPVRVEPGETAKKTAEKILKLWKSR